MKISISTIVAVLMFAVIFTGCKKDDDKKANEFQIGDTVIAIKGGALINYGEGTYHDGYNLDLNLFSEEVSVTEIEPGVRDWEGNGLRFYVEMFSETQGGLAEGTYVFNDTSDIYPVGSFDYFDYTFTSEMGGWIECEEGTIKVTKSGDTYEFVINAVDEFDNEVTGYYKGTLQYFVDDDAK